MCVTCLIIITWIRWKGVMGGLAQWILEPRDRLVTQMPCTLAHSLSRQCQDSDPSASEAPEIFCPQAGQITPSQTCLDPPARDSARDSNQSLQSGECIYMRNMQNMDFCIFLHILLYILADIFILSPEIYIYVCIFFLHIFTYLPTYIFLHIFCIFLHIFKHWVNIFTNICIFLFAYNVYLMHISAYFFAYFCT